MFSTLNLYEVITLVVALVMVAAYIVWFHKDWRILALLPVIGVALIISIDRTSQFLTTDETFTLIDTIYTVPLSPDIEGTQWFKAKFRTSTVVFGALSMVRHRFFSGTDILTVQFIMKCLHWLLGFVSLLPIHYMIARYFLKKPLLVSFTALFFPMSLLLPSSDLAFKMFNGDLLSMLWGVLALLMITVAYRDQNPLMGLGAVVVAFLAAQEKLIASPVLLLCAGVYVTVVAKLNRRRWLGVVKGVLVAFGVPLLIALIEVLILGVMRSGQNFTDYLVTAPEPFASWVWVILNSSSGPMTAGNLALPGVQITLITLFSAVAVAIGAILLLLLERSPLRIMTPLAAVWFERITLVLVPLMLIGAVAVTFGFTDALAAQRSMGPLLDGYISPADFNGRFWYPGAVSHPQYLLLFTGYAYAQLYINAIPTVIWLLFAIVAAGLLLNWRPDRRPSFIMEAALLGLLLVPLALALAQVQAVDRRYGNIFVYLMVLILIVKMLTAVAHKERLRNVLTVIVIVGLFAEIWAFRPMLGAFRPVWLNFDETRNSLITLWHADPVWIGYGEEAMLIGETVEADCASRDVEPCTMWSLFVGDWLVEDTELLQRRSRSNLTTWTYTSSDYYIYNRHAALDGWTIPDVEPVIVLSQRGYIQANIYRGDHLAEAGFRFERLTGAETIDQIR